MFCKYCGTDIPENTKYCPSCGSYQGPDVEADYTNGGSSDVNLEQGNEAKLDQLSGDILKWGILAIVFAWASCVPFLGIIFGSKAAKLVKEYEAIAPITGKANVGKILGKIGFILGIVMTILIVLIVTLYGCLFCGLIGSELYDSSYYYY